jgi:hypothetical protein
MPSTNCFARCTGFYHVAPPSRALRCHLPTSSIAGTSSPRWLPKFWMLPSDIPVLCLPLLAKHLVLSRTPVTTARFPATASNRILWGAVRLQQVTGLIQRSSSRPPGLMKFGPQNSVILKLRFAAGLRGTSWLMLRNKVFVQRLGSCSYRDVGFSRRDSA